MAVFSPLLDVLAGVPDPRWAAEGRDDAQALAVRGYCATIRSAITDNGRTPLAAPGLKLRTRLDAVAASLDRVGSKGGFRRQLVGRGLERTAPLWPDVERAYAWVHAAARVLGNKEGEDATNVRRCFNGLVGAMRRHRGLAGALVPATDHFAKVREGIDNSH